MHDFSAGTYINHTTIQERTVSGPDKNSSNPTEDFDKLHAYLNSIPPGPIDDPSELQNLLSPCWDQFDGSDEERMAGFKLIDRMEKVSWNPPMLTFTIERHGGTVLGSKRAPFHEWHLDLSDKTATFYITGYRQDKQNQSKLDVKQHAQRVSKLLFNHQDDDCLKWHKNGSVTVRIGVIIPDGSAARQTIEGRRKRFRAALNEILTTAGWEVIQPNLYRPPTS